MDNIRFFDHDRDIAIQYKDVTIVSTQASKTDDPLLKCLTTHRRLPSDTIPDYVPDHPLLKFLTMCRRTFTSCGYPTIKCAWELPKTDV